VGRVNKDNANIAIRGFMILTIIHIFFRVFGNTHSCCCSTKLAELSNPETPSIEAAKPKNIAEMILQLFVGGKL
jgi:hypothetical protein